MHKKTRNSREETRAMETHFYSMEFFFSFTRIFLYTFRKILYIFFMLCSYFQNNECKKISKFEREDKSNGIPLLHHGFFFLSREFSYIHSERFLTFLLYALFVFPEKWMQKNLEIRAGRQEEWNPTSTPWFFFSFTRNFIHTFRSTKV